MTKISALINVNNFLNTNLLRDLCGMHYKLTRIANHASSIVDKLEALLTDDARVIIYDHHVLIVQATGGQNLYHI
jgi:hypothetical protein